MVRKCQSGAKTIPFKPAHINTVYIKETPWDTITLENQKSFPLLLKIVNPSNLAFSDNIELSFVKLRPRLKKQKQTTSTLHSFFFLYTLKYYHSNHVECSWEWDEISKVKEVDRVLYLARSPESLVPSYSRGFDLSGQEQLPESFRDSTTVRMSVRQLNRLTILVLRARRVFFFFFFFFWGGGGNVVLKRTN